MAEEIAATATKKVGMATLRTFSSPSINIVKVIPQGIIELSLRGAAIVSKSLRSNFDLKKKNYRAIKEYM